MTRVGSRTHGSEVVEDTQREPGATAPPAGTTTTTSRALGPVRAGIRTSDDDFGASEGGAERRASRARWSGRGAPRTAPPARESGASARPVFLTPASRGLDPVTGRPDPARESRPLTAPDGRWDGAAVLRHLGQLSPVNTGDNAVDRCGAASLLAGAVLSGREPTLRVIDRLRAHVGAPAWRAELDAIRARIEAGRATLGDLHRVQEMMFARADGDRETRGLRDGEIARMQGELAADVRYAPVSRDGRLALHADGRRTVEEPARTLARLASMLPGEAIELTVDTDGDGATNHAVLLGRDAGGREYVYDPWPRRGLPHLTFRDEAPEVFDAYTRGALGPGGRRSDHAPRNAVLGGVLRF